MRYGVRFLLTCLFFEVSVGGYAGTRGTITDCQELIEGEIWSVTICSRSCVEVFHVLEATCEVVGHPTPSTTDLSTSLNTAHLRADWSAYIAQRLMPSSDLRLPPLIEHLTWTNHEEYDRGISKLWLERTRNEGELGLAKRIVAARYILACVVPNR